VFLLSFGFVASRLTFIRPERVILDLGLSAVALSCGMIAVFVGSGVLIKEYERRTVYLALVRPITRRQFIVGKFLGMGAVLLANWFLLVVAYVTILKLGPYRIPRHRPHFHFDSELFTDRNRPVFFDLLHDFTLRHDDFGRFSRGGQSLPNSAVINPATLQSGAFGTRGVRRDFPKF
jgi:hypothetical protein